MRLGWISALGMFACGAEEPTGDPNAMPPVGTPPDCTAYVYNGDTYDCTDLDRCDATLEYLPYRAACCACDPATCAPDPSCPDPGGWVG